MNKSYLRYLFKSKKSLCIVVCVLYALAYITAYITGSNNNNSCFLGVIFISVILGCLAYALVPIIFNFVHNKKAVDSYFSLPVTRKELLITSQLFIDITILVPFILLSIVTLIIGCINGSIVSIGASLLYIFVAIIGVIVTVMFVTSLFIEANSLFDGITMIVAYSLMPIFIMLLIDSFQENFVAGITPLSSEGLCSFISLPIGLVVSEFGLSCAVVDSLASISVHSLLKLVINVIWHLLVSLYCLKRNFIERKVERAETISNGFFSYPFVIYFYCFTLLFFCTEGIILSFELADIVLYFVIFVCFMIANFVYHRKIGFSFKDIAFFILAIVVAIAFCKISFETKGFGLANVYEHNYTNLGVSYDIYTSNPELEKMVKTVYPEYNFLSASYRSTFDNTDSNKEVIELIEKTRKGAIDNFYDDNIENRALGCYLLINSNINKELFLMGNYYVDNTNHAYYMSAPIMNIDELELLNKYRDVVIEISKEDEESVYDYKTITLNELIDSYNQKLESK